MGAVVLAIGNSKTVVIPTGFGYGIHLNPFAAG
jgi:hypothetical protein